MLLTELLLVARGVLTKLLFLIALEVLYVLFLRLLDKLLEDTILVFPLEDTVLVLEVVRPILFLSPLLDLWVLLEVIIPSTDLLLFL